MQNACSATVGKELSGNGRPGKDQRLTRANSLEAKEKKDRNKERIKKISQKRGVYHLFSITLSQFKMVRVERN